MKRLTTLTAISVLVGVGLVTGTAEAVVVKCDKGETISDALDAGARVIRVKGSCFENVTITLDDVQLKGHPSGGTVDGQDPEQSTILINGARRVVIDDLTVTGSGIGIEATQGASFTVQNSDISNNFSTGIEVSLGASAIITDNTINNNGDLGIDVFDGASVVITDNDINDSVFAGVFVGFNSSARLTGNDINNSGLTTEDCGIDSSRSSAVRLRGRNTVTNSGFAAICVYRGAVFRAGAPILAGGPPDTITQEGAGTLAVWASEGANAEFRNADITGNIEVSVVSSFRAQNLSITGDINAFGNSGVHVRNTVNFNGTLSCGGGSFTFGGAVQCGQTCNGATPITCTPP